MRRYLTVRTQRLAWEVRGGWRRATPVERVAATSIALILLVGGVLTFAVAPNIVYEDDAVMRIGMRRAPEPNTIEFAMFSQVKSRGSTMQVPKLNQLDLSDRDSSWYSGSVGPPIKAVRTLVRVSRDPDGLEIALMQRRYDDLRRVGQERLPSAWTIDQLSTDSWTQLSPHIVRAAGEPLGWLRYIWYAAFLALFATLVFWCVVRLS